jgi:hypothetical protein
MELLSSFMISYPNLFPRTMDAFLFIMLRPLYLIYFMVFFEKDLIKGFLNFYSYDLVDWGY